MSISAITSPCAKFCRNIINSRPMQYVAKQYAKDNYRFMTNVAITSIVLKDALGCYMYVTQSLNNKKIPEEKRPFVAALDLANGGLMIGAQILACITIGNKTFQEKMFNSLFGKRLNRSFRKGIIGKLSEKFGDLGPKVMNNNYAAFKKSAVGALSMFTTLVASTIFAKRVVVPFIATPLATYLKENVLGVKKEKKSKPMTNDDICKQSIQNKLGKYNIENFTQSK